MEIANFIKDTLGDCTHDSTNTKNWFKGACIAQSETVRMTLF